MNDILKIIGKRNYREVCSQEAGRGIGWWKMGICKLKGVRGNI
jgi:hypothetical protein